MGSRAEFDFTSRPNPCSSILPLLHSVANINMTETRVAAKRGTASNQNLSSLLSTCNISRHMLHDETENNKEGKHPNTSDHM